MAKHKRSNGLALLAIGMGTFAGTTNGLLPAVAFWPALAVSALGCFVFMRANRVHLEAAERKASRAVNPTIRNRGAQENADRQARTDGQRLAALATERPGPSPDRGAATAAPREILLSDVEPAAPSGKEKFVVSTDVSVPLEVQQKASLADQIVKLQKLLEDGTISAEEFAAAKAKLLG